MLSCGAPAFFYHRILPRGKAAGFNRRMRKNARPVVWEGGGAQSPSLDPIKVAAPLAPLAVLHDAVDLFEIADVFGRVGVE
jgi:hypothetical protein